MHFYQLQPKTGGLQPKLAYRVSKALEELWMQEQP